MGNTNLRSAASNKKDEFYTMYEDVDDELRYYTHHFEGKTIYCNCDDYKTSNFFKYFVDNFERFKLKKVIATGYDVVTREGVGAVYDGELSVLASVSGDFADNEEHLQEVDIVITNPPFSLFREFVTELVTLQKDFILIGNINAVTYKGFFELLRDGKVNFSYNSMKTRKYLLHPSYEKFSYETKDGKVGIVSNTAWFTTLPHNKPVKPLELSSHYNPENHPKYDNYEAIDIRRTNLIPCDFSGIMGVPVSFLNVYDPQQFEIIGSNRSISQDPEGVYGRSTYIDGKETFKRIFIRKKG